MSSCPDRQSAKKIPQTCCQIVWCGCNQIVLEATITSYVALFTTMIGIRTSDEIVFSTGVLILLLMFS